MKLIQHPTNNAVFSPPVDMSNEQCAPLPATVVQYDDGTYGIQSYWKPSEDDLAKLAAGKSICLTVLGTSLPPVLVEVEE